MHINAHDSLRWFLFAAIGCAWGDERITVTGVSKSFGEPIAVVLTHPVIVAELLTLRRHADVAVRSGVVNETCLDADLDETVTGRAALHYDCLIEITRGTACAIDVDGVSRSFDLPADAESMWFKLERPPG